VHAVRKHGSARFAPYFKAQWWDERGLCWRDVQKACPTREAAQVLFTADKRWRVMQVSEEGRRPLAE
jgi:hypothetical protein